MYCYYYIVHLLTSRFIILYLIRWFKYSKHYSSKKMFLTYFLRIAAVKMLFILYSSQSHCFIVNKTQKWITLITQMMNLRLAAVGRLPRLGPVSPLQGGQFCDAGRRCVICSPLYKQSHRTGQEHPWFSPVCPCWKVCLTCQNAAVRIVKDAQYTVPARLCYWTDNNDITMTSMYWSMKEMG